MKSGHKTLSFLVLVVRSVAAKPSKDPDNYNHVRLRDLLYAASGADAKPPLTFFLKYAERTSKETMSEAGENHEQFWNGLLEFPHNCTSWAADCPSSAFEKWLACIIYGPTVGDRGEDAEGFGAVGV